MSTREVLEQQRERMRRLLTAREVALWLATSESTLCRMRQAGTGPKWIAINGSPRYRTGDVETYLREQESR